MKKSVTLNPGESKVVSFTFTPTVAGAHIVSADGLGGFFNVLEPLVAEFQVTDLQIDPAEVYVGEAVNISVVVTNTGNKAGSYEVNCVVSS